VIDTLAADFSDLPNAGAAARITVHLVIAARFGAARLRAGTARQAGAVRTHMLVTIGAALFVLITQ